jgi:hypothetical protein
LRIQKERPIVGEFPTAWHRERYISDLEREVEGAKKRLAELKELVVVDAVLDAAKDAVRNAETELDRARKTPVPKSTTGAEKKVDDDGEKPLDKMKLAELVAHAESVGIEGEDLDALKKPGVSKAKVREAIDAKLAAS